jgi:hypothetical protein
MLYPNPYNNKSIHMKTKTHLISGITLATLLTCQSLPAQTVTDAESSTSSKPINPIVQTVKPLTETVLAQVRKVKPSQPGAIIDSKVTIGKNLLEMRERGLSVPLVVAPGQTNATVLGEIEQDLTIMARILQHTVQEIQVLQVQDGALGIDVFPSNGPRRLQSLYLEDYGALFVLHVNTPLTPPEAPEEAEEEKSVQTTEWEETRKELFWDDFRKEHPEWQLLFGSEQPDELHYDAEKVAKLKDNLVLALKNAANIRHVDPKDWITLTVRGGERSPAARIWHKPKAADQIKSLVWASAGRTPNSPSTLVMRVKKSEVDRFASEDLSPEEFKQQVTIALY